MFSGIEFEGYVGNVEPKVLNDGKNLVKLRVSCRRNFPSGKDEQGKNQYESDWFNCTVWGKLVQFASTLGKGDRIIVRGRIKFDKKQDQTGQTREFHDVNVDTIDLVSKKPGSYDQNGGNNFQQPAQPQPQPSNFSQPNNGGFNQPNNGGFAAPNNFGNQQAPFGQPAPAPAQPQPSSSFAQPTNFSAPNGGF